MMVEDGLAAAQRALDADDIDLALLAWQAVRAEHPEHPAAYALAAPLLVQTKRADEAERMMARAPLAVLGEIGFVWEWAWVAHNSGDFATAIRRWQIFQALFPDSAVGYSGLAVSLRDDKQNAAAEQILAIATERFPEAISPLIEFATLAHLQADWPEALRRWTMLRERFPDDIRGYTGVADTLRETGEFADAEAVLRDAITRFPNDTMVLASHAELAEAQQDWPLAAARWEVASARDPTNGLVGHKLMVARMRLLDFNLTGAAAAAAGEPMRFTGADASIPADEQSEMFALMMTFESLGGVAVGCEFGGVQRRYGAEPLGLLRWSQIRPEKLIEALDNAFEGVGLPGNTTIVPFSDSPDAEYYTIDTRYGMNTHTFERVGEGDPGRLLEGACRRLQFLRRKLLEDLTEARKIFVYKIYGIEMTDADIRRLHTALCRYGPNTLLCVRLADDAHPDGSVERIGPRLMIGYVQRFAGGRHDGGWDEPLPSWSNVCRAAARMRQADSA